MDLVWLKLTAAGPARSAGEQTVTDVLWANARPEDRVEHISVHSDDDPRVLIVALFLLTGPSGPSRAAARGLRLARAAIAASPALAGWTARLDDRGDLGVKPSPQTTEEL